MRSHKDAGRIDNAQAVCRVTHQARVVIGTASLAFSALSGALCPATRAGTSDATSNVLEDRLCLAVRAVFTVLVLMQDWAERILANGV